jgi:alpha-glucosidase
MNKIIPKLKPSRKTQLLIAAMLIFAVVFFFLPVCIPQAMDVVSDEDRSGCVVSKPPIEYGFDPFYEKYCEMDGIPIISSAAVDDLALQQTYYILANLLAPITYVRDEFVDLGVYFVIIGRFENQTTLPEYAHLDSAYWDNRARGLGASGSDRVSSAGEENLLCLSMDRYRGESIAVHEFAHTIHLLGLRRTVFGFDSRLRLLYYWAKIEGLWVDTYAGSNMKEYWAEGVQSYFGTNLQQQPSDGIHNWVNTPDELAQYDPRLYQFIDSVFGGFRWTPTCP